MRLRTIFEASFQKRRFMELARAILLLAIFIGISFAIPIGIKKLKQKVLSKTKKNGGSCCS